MPAGQGDAAASPGLHSTPRHGPSPRHDAARSFTLLTRAYCSLCDEMLREATEVARANSMRIQVIDIDAHPDLVDRWDTLVPVLFLGPPEPQHELCHYHFDARRVTAAIACARGAAAAVAGPMQIG